jgi:hypothetical protein
VTSEPCFIEPFLEFTSAHYFRRRHCG